MEGTTKQKLKYMNEKSGWIHLMKILDDAAKSGLIDPATEANRFLDHMRTVVDEAFKARSVLEIKGLIDIEIKSDLEEVVSHHARKIAKKGHEEDIPIIAWIRSEFMATEGKRSKRAFAEEYAPKIYEEYGKKRKKRTISEVWLKGL